MDEIFLKLIRNFINVHVCDVFAKIKPLPEPDLPWRNLILYRWISIATRS